MSRKIVINRCYGGFGLSTEAEELYKKLSGKKEVWDFRLKREDKFLIEVVEKLGEKASGRFSELKIVKIPDDVEYVIEQYDGIEWIAEKHRTWR